MSKAVSKKNVAPEKIVEFDHEYEFEGKKFSSCKMRKPRLGDRMRNGKLAEIHGLNPEEMEVHLVSRLTSLPVAFLESMWLEDYLKLDRAFADFLLSKKKKSTQS